jgi:hypothetical protein
MDKALYRSALGITFATGFILLIPLLAMQFTDEVVWTLTDFVFAGALLAGTGLTFELVLRRSSHIAYRAAAGVALATAFILVWSNAAVGVIGDEGDDANLMYFGVLTVGPVGAIIARFRADGMARVMFATALAVALVAVVALTAGKQGEPHSSVSEILGLNGFFAALFAGSGLLFWLAARGQLSEAEGQEGRPRRL